MFRRQRKMYLNVEILLNYILYFNFVNSCEHYPEYIKLLEKLENPEENVEICMLMQNYYNYICDPNVKSILKWAAICKAMIDRLRKKGEFDNVYVNYLAFLNNDKCSMINVYIPAWNKYASQSALLCYVGPAIIPGDGSYEPPHYKQIAIFPETSDRMMIFKQNPITNYYHLVDVLEKFRWRSYSNFSPQLFEITLPKSYSTVNGMYNELYRSIQYLGTNRLRTDNFLNTKLNIQQMCEIAYRRGKYPNFIVCYSNTMQEPSYVLATLSAVKPNSEIHFYISLYECLLKTETSEGTNYFTNYKIAAGPDDNSVILIQQKNDNRFEIIEYIKNLSLNYIYFLKEKYY